MVVGPIGLWWEGQIIESYKKPGLSTKMHLTFQIFCAPTQKNMDANKHVHQLSHATVFFMDCDWLTVTFDPKIHLDSQGGAAACH